MVKKAHRTCPRDGFPMLRIQGQWECVGEYLIRCIGRQKIVDMVQRKATVYYVFKNGHELPLLCFCCDSPLVVDDLEKAIREMKGRRFKGVDMALSLPQDGSEILHLHLLFSKKSLLGRRMREALSIRVAARMRHPPDCPTRLKSQRRRGRKQKR
jgi:hypothetical protein